MRIRLITIVFESNTGFSYKDDRVPPVNDETHITYGILVNFQK